MIATHNIKVNGRWVCAGEYYEEAKELTEIKTLVEQLDEPKAPVLETEPEAPVEEPAAEEAPKAEPKRTNRRKTTK